MTNLYWGNDVRTNLFDQSGSMVLIDLEDVLFFQGYSGWEYRTVK